MSRVLWANRNKVLAGLLGFFTVTVFAIRAINPGGVRDRLVRRYQKEGIAGLVRAVGNRIDGRHLQRAAPDPRPLGLVLTGMAARPSMSIVQIGAYIGDTPNDPLFKFLQLEVPKRSVANLDTKVVLVEPIRAYFDQLRENYAGLPDVEFENLAISERDGFLEMYTLDVDPVDHGFPGWLSQLSSLKKERMDELWDQYERMEEAQAFYLEHRVVERVKSIPLSQLLHRYELSSLDLLQIDAEGYDYEILKTLDFGKIKPRFINYERVLLAETEDACRRMLTGQGYILMDWGQDTLAILVDESSAVGDTSTHE